MQVTTKANTVVVLHISALCSELGSSCQYLRFAWGITWDLTASISLSLSQIPGWTWRKSTLRTWRRKLPAVFSATEQFPVWYTLAPGIPQWHEALGPMAVAVLMILFYWELFFFQASFPCHIAPDCFSNNLLTLNVLIPNSSWFLLWGASFSVNC